MLSFCIASIWICIVCTDFVKKKNVDVRINALFQTNFSITPFTALLFGLYSI